MFERLASWLVDPIALMPLGFCLQREPGFVWPYAVSEAGIALAYFVIPLALAVFARRRPDPLFPPLRPILRLIASSILLCGITHLLAVITLWTPAYGLEAIVKAATSVVSIAAAIALCRVLPQALALPSRKHLEETYTALRASEERLHHAQKMEAVGQLTGGIAHDFNNMLQSITGGLELVERRIAQGHAAEAARYIDLARKAADNASALTNRMLAFARRQALQPTIIAPNALLRGMKQLIQTGVGPTVHVELHLLDGKWSATCDGSQLESALLNLAINARDAMPEGGTLKLETADRTLALADLADQEGVQAGDYVEIAITDTGMGMSRDVLLRAFEPFFTTKPFGSGTGLGLSQVYGFTRQSGGFVRLESQPGDGTTVRLFLPRKDSPAADVSGSSEATPTAHHYVDPAKTSTTADATVLVVEDEERIREMIVGLLNEQGYSVMEAEDGPSGLRIVQSSVRLDLLLTDVGLPGLNGRQLADAARASRPDLPVLFITGYAGTSFDNVLGSGVQVLRKPFTFEALTARVRNMIDDSLVRQSS
jgi:signal transduction histidine kinase/CheY-like chemotaxis protein